jgi:hypothetical protein
VVSNTIAVFMLQRDKVVCSDVLKGRAKSFIKEARTGFASTSSVLIQPQLHVLQTHLTVTSGPIQLTSSPSAPNCASVADWESKLKQPRI